LVDTGRANPPTLGQHPRRPVSTVQSCQLVVESKRETVGNVPRRGSVELVGVQGGGVRATTNAGTASTRIVFGTGASVGSIKESTLGTSSHIKGHAVVVRFAIVVC